ncbi:MAG TPA: IclR family transcriptional regulator, partial [Anaerolineae bacterium]|nr:IclR family transcriptional regulator [Anaerolineae bacterium]
TGETVHLAMLMDNQAVFIAQELSSKVFGINTEIGQREPLHCTAVGKALVAFLPEEQLDAIIEELDFARYTTKTITSPQVFKAHCSEIRARGYAVDDEEFYEGLRCIGAPIRGHGGIVLASLGISGLSTRLRMKRIPALAEIVVKYAEEISARLGYVPPAG